MRVLAFLLTFATLGCSRSDATQLIVRVIDGTHGELTVPDDLDAFEVRVATVDATGGDRVRFRRTFGLAAGAGARGARGGVTLPQMLGVVPAVGGTGTVRIDVFGVRQGIVVQRISRVTRYGVGAVELPPFALTPLCFGVTCPAGTTCEIDGTCGDPDPSCGADARCDAGVVITGPCGTTGVLCDARCIPYDDDNCGACAVACPTGERCIANRCACSVGTARCGASCVVLESDPSHCGACGHACSSPTATLECRSGSCAVTACGAGQADCDGRGDNGCETSLTSDSDCGSCGHECPPAERCGAGGRCRCGGGASCGPAGHCLGDACAPVCGDGACEGGETCSGCSEDCGACPRCGDAACNGTETCSTCAMDCGACPRCGDGACTGSESCSTCAMDCGVCPPRCGDAACNGTETCSTCAMDCGACPPRCSDAMCNGGETCSTCPGDCGVCPPACGELREGRSLSRGDTLTSCDGRFTLSMQGDGNLVLYQGGTPLWATSTSTGSVASMQGDGNFVLYDPGGTPLFATDTGGNPHAWLAVQNDGNLVVYTSAGTPIWAR